MPPEHGNEVEVAPELTDTTPRFEEAFGYSFREATRNRARDPRIQADGTIRFGFRQAPDAAIQVGVDVVVCLDEVNGGGAVWPAASERRCADDSKAAPTAP
ncbi:MAG: hypothetical protein Q8P18_09590 [Pseudomonadota bacterium]|nr:hypothetical protein [Pseudomonadota bacterium]